MHVLRLASGDPDAWTQVGDQQILVSDRVDEAAEPDAKMTVGFARVAAGEELEISFPYDEVLIVSKGAYVVRTEQGDEVSARAGDVIYLPAGSVSSSRAEEDTEIVYV